MLELFLVELGRIFLETLPNNIWWCRCCLTIYFKVFWPRDPTVFCYSPVFSHSNYPPHRALGRYRHTFSSRQFRNIFVDWKLIIALMVEMGIFTALALFLKPLHQCVKLNYLLLHIRNIFFVFFHCDGWLREFGLCFPPIYISVKQEAMAG